MNRVSRVKIDPYYPPSGKYEDVSAMDVVVQNVRCVDLVQRTYCVVRNFDRDVVYRQTLGVVKILQKECFRQPVVFVYVVPCLRKGGQLDKIIAVFIGELEPTEAVWHDAFLARATAQKVLVSLLRFVKSLERMRRTLLWFSIAHHRDLLVTKLECDVQIRVTDNECP